MKPEAMTPVTSSVATHVHYDPAARHLFVRFKQSGAVHRYDDVPIDKAETVMQAHSFGSALNKLVLGKHVATKL